MQWHTYQGVRPAGTASSIQLDLQSEVGSNGFWNACHIHPFHGPFHQEPCHSAMISWRWSLSLFSDRTHKPPFPSFLWCSSCSLSSLALSFSPCVSHMEIISGLGAEGWVDGLRYPKPRPGSALTPAPLSTKPLICTFSVEGCFLQANFLFLLLFFWKWPQG